MSHVDNVFFSISILEDSEPIPDGADRWTLIERCNAWLRENAGGQQFGPELGYFDLAYGGSKFLESPVFVGAFNYMPEREFLAFASTLPWEYREQVQYIVRRQHTDLFEIVRLDHDADD